jgi:DNA-binding Xre family transcriptional regulator
MSFSYNPLWKLLIDKGLTKEQLRKQIRMSSSTMAKMTNGEYVAMEVLERICQYFDCQLSDIVEFVKDEK